MCKFLENLAVAAVLFSVSTGLIGVARATAAELIMFERESCEWCEAWDMEIADIYPKTQEGKRAPLRRVDVAEAIPSDIEHIPRGNYTPTFVLIDNGQEIGRIRGYPGEAFFWGMLGEIMRRLPDHVTESAILTD